AGRSCAGASARPSLRPRCASSTGRRPGSDLSDRLGELTAGFRLVDLDDVDRRLALQRRVDQKHLVTPDTLRSLLRSMRSDHDILEIDGRRAFDYESTYFDTPSLECFREHIENRRPRYKARTRCYVD